MTSNLDLTVDTIQIVFSDVDLSRFLKVEALENQYRCDILSLNNYNFVN